MDRSRPAVPRIPRAPVDQPALGAAVARTPRPVISTAVPPRDLPANGRAPRVAARRPTRTRRACRPCRPHSARDPIRVGTVPVALADRSAPSTCPGRTAPAVLVSPGGRAVPAALVALVAGRVGTGRRSWARLRVSRVAGATVRRPRRWARTGGAAGASPARVVAVAEGREAGVREGPEAAGRGIRATSTTTMTTASRAVPGGSGSSPAGRSSWPGSPFWWPASSA